LGKLIGQTSGIVINQLIISDDNHVKKAQREGLENAFWRGIRERQALRLYRYESEACEWRGFIFRWLKSSAIDKPQFGSAKPFHSNVLQIFLHLLPSVLTDGKESYRTTSASAAFFSLFLAEDKGWEMHLAGAFGRRKHCVSAEMRLKPVNEEALFSVD